VPSKPKKSPQAKRRKPLSAAAEKFIKNKAAKSRFTPGQLRSVYRRGQGAYLSSGSRNVSMDAWARGRVNSFVSGKGGARKADKDLMRKKKK
jgi:Holliday junction resolvasome RuvABC endonuclease subunit